MKKNAKPSKKDLQDKVTDLLNAFVKSMTTVDTKKIKKSVRQASKIVAKAVAKTLLEYKVDSTAKKSTTAKKTTAEKTSNLRKASKKVSVKPAVQALSTLLKKKQTNLLNQGSNKTAPKKITPEKVVIKTKPMKAKNDNVTEEIKKAVIS